MRIRRRGLQVRRVPSVPAHREGNKRRADVLPAVEKSHICKDDIAIVPGFE